MRKYFLTGLFVLLPLVLTLYLLVLGFNFIDGILGNFIADIFGRPIPGVGLVVTLLLIMATGVFATNVLGRRLIHFGEKVFLRIPIANSIYQSIKQIIEALSFSNSVEKTAAFREVVMVEYPRDGIYSIGFVTSETQKEAESIIGEPCLSVFIPTTPNPTSGFFLIIPVKKCIHMEMSVEDAFKLIISGGVITPEWKSTKTGD